MSRRPRRAGQVLASSPLSLDRASAGISAGDRFALIVCALLGFYALYDAAVFYATPEQRAVYAVAAAPVLLGGAAVAARVGLSRRLWMVVLLLVALVLLPFATGLTRHGLHLDHLVGDAATTLVPLAFLLAAAAAPALRRDSPAVRLLLMALLLAACVAPVLGRNLSGRFEPPSVLLACAALAAFAHRRGKVRVVMTVGYALLFALVVASLERTMIVAWLALPFATLTLRRGLPKTLGLVTTVLLALAAVVALLPADQRGEVANRLRIGPLAKGEADPSLLERFEEVHDIRGEMQGWTALQWLAGAGHGACWRLVDATPHAQNVQADGTVHHVHITPVALAYRYGALGMLAAVLFAGLALRPFLRLRGDPAVGDDAEATTFFRLAAVAYLWTSLLSAALVDPLLSFVLAGRVLAGRRDGERTAIS